MTLGTTISSNPSNTLAAKRVRVLIVDDSVVVRQMLTRELSRDPGIEVVGSAADPYAARDKLVELHPDVITLDVEMPRMDGISFLRKLMQFTPMPVIILSSLASTGSQTAIDALNAGAVDVVAKPGSSGSIGDLGPVLAKKIKQAAGTCGQLRKGPARDETAVANHVVYKGRHDRILAIGASTGGVQAITTVLRQFPENAPATVIVQHMPPRFTASFADRLNQMCRVRVKEAASGDTLQAGHVLIAPGGFHMLLRRTGPRYYVEIKDGPEVLHQKPAVDVLFTSVAKAAGPLAVGAVLTGMGADGARGLLEMRNAGASTIAQDRESCVVFGMPNEAIKRGAAQHVVTLDEIAPKMLELAHLSVEGPV